MNTQTVEWFAAGSVITGALVSVFRPDNGLCPINLSPRGRAIVAGVLAAGQGFLQAMLGGDTWVTAMATSVATLLVVLGAHGNTASDTPLQPLGMRGFTTNLTTGEIR